MKYLLSALAVGVLAGCAPRENATEKSAEPKSTVAPSTELAATEAPRTKKPTSKPVTIRYRNEVPAGVTLANKLTVPRGFDVRVWAENLDGPRRLLVVPRGKNADVLVAESNGNRVSLLRDADGNGSPETRSVLVSEQRQPFGLAVQNGWLYVGNTDAVVRLTYKIGETKAGAPQKILDLPDGGHWTRNLLFSRDGKKLFVAVGSECNTCEEEAPRAAISTVNPDGSGLKTWASGLRNPVGMALRPGTDELWTVVNERDNLGDDLPPDYLTRVDKGAFYGWPYALTDIDRKTTPDPSFGDKNPTLVKQTTAPTVPVQAHSAALGVAFYDRAQFGAGFNGDAFLAFHGSWNRSTKTGYKIVRVDFQNGVPVEVSDFVRGFQNGEDVWGRPVDVAVLPDGSLLFSDDGGGKIWRVTKK
ncbi:MAG TPA: PQQ-dependent sugar dehydrogenase [Abditibacteriaceae bacterium]|jgi:glucose/arabinose dehydrogenase